jgi:hypothetical protein
MKDGILIFIEKTTAAKIKKKALTKNESYDEILNRLIPKDERPQKK